ncbi:uncharacterized protein LOC143622575 [Bidens hawaiensis]|uniref:uncharacterized protein LOC143622575 n=1 Tax=Bidens hawaiensis TaxID=980011 RepID=UPI00404A11DD
MATQEYIRKAVEDPEEDEDFKRTPWLSAVEFVNSDGMIDSGLIAHLGDINKCEETGKLDLVVAVIKSCTPNGLGDMMVTLKDPTGTVFGTIHHKVLTEGDIRKGICVGSALILYKVSVVSLSRSTHYLNITKRNLVKVFYKDGGSSQKQTFHGTINAAPPSQALYKDGGSSQRPTFHGTLNAAPHSQVFYKDGGSSQRQTFNETINAAPRSGYKSTELFSQDPGRGTPLLSSAFSLERGAEGIVSRMKRSNTNNEQENMSYTNTTTTNKDTNLKIAQDMEILKEANVIENVGPGQLKEGFPNVHGWTDEQIQEISDWDFN